MEENLGCEEAELGRVLMLFNFGVAEDEYHGQPRKQTTGSSAKFSLEAPKKSASTHPTLEALCKNLAL